jgi:hypothetical protein
MSRHRRRATRAITGLVALATLYLLVAYLLLPWLWWAAERRHHPALDTLPVVTRNADGIPGDPLNVGLVGTRAELIRAMLAAGWRPTDPITFTTSLEIAASVLLDRPDPEAPVSPLFVFGRRQDLAFEQEVGSSADRRHHVRWWRAEPLDAAGRPFWIGDATFDIGAGLSHLTGQITHHIAPDVDEQRDQLMADLERAGQLVRRYPWPGIGATQDGRNAEGDRYVTDGMIDVGVLVPAALPPKARPAAGMGRSFAHRAILDRPGGTFRIKACVRPPIEKDEKVI